MTAQEYIEAALEEIGAIMVGETPDSATLTWGLRKLNTMLKTIFADEINIYKRTHENFSVVAGTASYTIGSGGDFDTDRPILIETAFTQDSDNENTEVFVKPIHDYWLLDNHATQGKISNLYYDKDFPLGTIYLYHSPDKTYDLHIVSQKSLVEPVSLSTSIVFPDIYEEVLITKLAIRLAPRYGITVSPELIAASKEAYSNLKEAYLNLKALNLSRTLKGKNLNINGVNLFHSINSDTL